jgi:hypothetical protein
MEVVAIRAAAQAEQLQRELAAVTAERDATRDALTRIASQLASVGLWAEVEKSPAPEVDGVGLLTTRYLVERESAAAETARADLLDAEAVSQRQRAEAVEAELFDVDRALHTLGAYGAGPTKERLLQVLTPEDRRAILEFDAAEARMDLARLKARRVNPPPPEKLAEYAEKLAKVEAQIAALDLLPDAGNMVQR